MTNQDRPPGSPAGGGSMVAHVVTNAADLQVEFLDRPSTADISTAVPTPTIRMLPGLGFDCERRKITLVRRLLLAVHFLTAAACESALDVGDWKCGAAPLFIPPDGSPELPGRETIVNLDWQSGFEDGFCGYVRSRGFCYSVPGATYKIVDAPARSGRKAAAFTVSTDDDQDGDQTRCVREGVMPKDAYYGAWFYIPGGTINHDNWNLMHFRNAAQGEAPRGDWDVSLVSTDDGRLVPLLADYVNDGPNPPSWDFEVPVDRWFSLSLRLVRETTPTGVAALYLNGELVVERTDIVTVRDAAWGQWYVGNLATDLTPSDSTIYVDDVSIRENLDVSP